MDATCSLWQLAQGLVYLRHDGQWFLTGGYSLRVPTPAPLANKDVWILTQTTGFKQKTPPTSTKKTEVPNKNLEVLQVPLKPSKGSNKNRSEISELGTGPGFAWRFYAFLVERWLIQKKMHHVIDIYIYTFFCIYIYIRTSTQVLKVALHCRIWWFAIPSWRSAGSSGSCCLWRCGRCRGCGICADGHWIHGSKFPLDSFQWPDLVVAVCVLKAVEEFYSSIYILHVRLRISLQSLVVMVMVIKQSLHDCVFFLTSFAISWDCFLGLIRIGSRDLMHPHGSVGKFLKIRLPNINIFASCMILNHFGNTEKNMNMNLTLFNCLNHIFHSLFEYHKILYWSP